MSVNGDRGKRWERAVAEVLRGHGHPYAERALGLGAHYDRGDIGGVPGFYLEAKDCARHELAKWSDEARVQAAVAGTRAGVELVPVLVIKRRLEHPERAYAVLELARFAEVIA